MPHYASKFSSSFLDDQEFQNLLNALPGKLATVTGPGTYSVTYGYGTNIHADLWYKPMRVSSQQLEQFLHDSVEQNIFEVGESDLNIALPDNQISVMLCHESDIHIDGNNLELVQRLISEFSTLDIRSAEAWRKHHENKPSNGS